MTILRENTPNRNLPALDWQQKCEYKFDELKDSSIRSLYTNEELAEVKAILVNFPEEIFLQTI